MNRLADDIKKPVVAKKTDQPVSKPAEKAAEQAEAPKKRGFDWGRLLVGAVIAACMAGVVLISQLFLIDNSLRLDESQSVWQASHSLSGMLGVVAQDVHMPLYHILLQQWMHLFGDSVVSVRSMSMVFFLATIPFVYLLARLVLSRKWSLIVTILFSLSPFMNWYANEARMYTLLVFFAAANQYFYARILKDGKGWFGYLLTTIFGAYSHYFFMFNLLAQAMFYLVNRKKYFRPGMFKRFIGVMVALAVALSPWVAYFIMSGLASNTRPLIERPTAVNFFNVYSQFLFGFQTDAVNTAIVSLWPLILIIAFFTVKRHLRMDRVVAYLLTMAFVPIIVAFALSFVVTPFFLSRYMVSAIAPLTIALVWLISRYGPKFSTLLITLWFLIVGATFTQQLASADTPVKEDFKAAAQSIEKTSSVHDIIVLSSPFTVYPFEYYYDGPLQIRTLPLWDRQNIGAVPTFSEERLPEEVETLKEGHDYIYLLLSYDQGYEEEIYQHFNMRYEKVKTQKFSNDLTLHVYRVGYDVMPEVLPTVDQ
ncbi:glycosyltransferase family 39 protein [Candidatus Saccharibacteria bacterium]|nr:glycosyltransferase family 39 protein [Candidatus Saccharibacteria bacterium]